MVAVEHRHQPKAAQQSNFCNVAAPTADEAAEGAEKRAAVDAALAAAPRSIRGARYCIGSQQHFYMEPQVREALRHSVALLAIRVIHHCASEDACKAVSRCLSAMRHRSLLAQHQLRPNWLENAS